MTRTLLVAPTGHGVGLTATCLGLVHALERLGVKVGFFKPLAQPRAGGADEDRSTALVRLTSSLRPPEPISVPRVEKALSRDELDSLLEDVVAAAEPLIAENDVVVVEGLAPGSGMVYASRTNVALAKALDADVLLVGAPDGPADLEHLAETMEITARTYQGGERTRVVGAVVNRVPGLDAATTEEIRGLLAGRELALVGAVPFSHELGWPRVSDAVRGLDVRVLNQGETHRRVQEVIVGAQAVPGILPLLRGGRLLIVPGDRDEIILSVCLAAMNGTRFAGLLLTLGVEPDPRVWELCRPAAATGLPILLTQKNSYETANTVHDMDPEVPTDDHERAGLVMTAVADALDADWLATLPTPDHVPRLSPPAFRRRLAVEARAADHRIVLPEGTEPRTIRAAVSCHDMGLARCVLLGPPAEVAAQAEALGLTIPDG
ncbi:MAG: phosphate acyltransferase, partial [Nocardioides sp.]